MSQRFIINPAARRCPANVEQAIRHRFPDADVRFTSGPGDAGVLAREAVKMSGPDDLLVVGGGDGTFREVAGAVGNCCPLGVLPLGTVNQLARQLGVPQTLEGALGLLVEGEPRTVYAGWCRLDEGERQPFFIGVSAGWDAAAVHGVRARMKKWLGIIAYGFSGLEQMVKPLERVHWEIGDKKGEGTQIIVMRNTRYGWLMTMTEDAGPERPGLETLVVDGGRLSMLCFFLRSLLGPPPDSGWIAHRRGSPVILNRNKPGPFQIDGDPIVARRLTLEADPTPIRILSGR